MSDARRLLKLRADLELCKREAQELDCEMIVRLIEMADLELTNRMAQVRPGVWGPDRPLAS